jgi:hypothetical protein
VDAANGWDLTQCIQLLTRAGRKRLADERATWERFSGALALEH